MAYRRGAATDSLAVTLHAITSRARTNTPHTNQALLPTNPRR